MAQKNDSLHDRLLGHLPQPENLAAYREEVAAGLAKNAKALRQEKWIVSLLWFTVVGISITFFVSVGVGRLDTAKATLFGVQACWWMLFGAAELLKHFINRSRVEVLKEVKQLQLQVLELQASLQKPGGK
jgi:hypothetical protein